MRLLIAKLTNASIQSVSVALNAESDVADLATDLESCVRLLRDGGYDLILLITGPGRVRARDALTRLRREAGGVPMVVLTEPTTKELGVLDQGRRERGQREHAPREAAPRERAMRPSGGGASYGEPRPPAGRADAADSGWAWRSAGVAPAGHPSATAERFSRLPPIRLEPDGETLRAGDRMVGLSHAESRIFSRLWEQRGEIVSAEDLMTAIYGVGERPASRVLPVFLFKLRRKLSGLGFEDLIETSVGRGFMIRAEAHAGRVQTEA